MSWQLSALRRMLRWTVRPVMARITDWKLARTSFVVMGKLGFRRVAGTRYRRAEGALAPGLWVTARAAPQPGIVLYFHGGAYLMGSPRTYWELAGRLARQSGRAIFLPDYPLAPEAPAPAAFQAAIRCWRALLEAGHAPTDIVIGGDSAGGGLALALLAHVLQDEQRPAGCFAFSPWTDLTLSGPSLRTNAACEVMLPAERLEEVRDMVRGTLDPADPRLSPLFARFPDCPPVFLSWSETEILRDDGRRMADALTAQGASVECDVQKDAPHVWQLFHGQVPEADASIRRASDFIAAVLPSPRSGES